MEKKSFADKKALREKEWMASCGFCAGGSGTGQSASAVFAAGCRVTRTKLRVHYASLGECQEARFQTQFGKSLVKAGRARM